MSKNYFLFLFILLFTFLGFAQEQLLRGKIMAHTKDLENINVTNLMTNKTVTTLETGYFEIKTSVGDSLFFSAIQFKGKKIKIKKEDFLNDLLFVNLELADYQLKEVVIDEYKNINAVSVGVLSKPAKKYTPAERRINEATTGGGIVPLNPILNAISGRTNMLKKELVVERKEYVIRKLNEWFEDSYYTTKHAIPVDFIEGFKYFLADNKQFENTVWAKKKTLTIFYMGGLAADYLQLIKE